MSNQSGRQTSGPFGEASFDIKEIVILGMAGAGFTLLTAPWAELPGKLVYGTLSPMMGAVLMSIIKAYLSGTAIGGRRLGMLAMLTALWRFSELPWERKKSILLLGFRIGLMSSVISVSAVAGIEAGIQALGGSIDAPNGGQYDGEGTQEVTQ